MTLIQMQYFQAVCQFGSFLKASEQLHVSQSTISLAIKSMENEHKVSLFHRDKNALRITEAGQAVLEEVDIILAQYNHLKETIQNLISQRYSIRVGVSTLGGNAIFPLIMAEAKKQEPDLVITTVEDSTKRQFEMLDNHLLDVIFTHHHFKNAGEKAAFDSVYGSLSLIKDRQVYCVSRANPLALQDSVTLEDIAKQPLILLKDNFSQTVAIKQRFTECGLNPHILLQTSQMYTVERYIENNIATGFLPQSAVRHNPQVKSYVLDTFPSRYVSCFWRKDKQKTDALKKFLAVARTVSQKIEANS